VFRRQSDGDEEEDDDDDESRGFGSTTEDVVGGDDNDPTQLYSLADIATASASLKSYDDDAADTAPVNIQTFTQYPTHVDVRPQYEILESAASLDGKRDNKYRKQLFAEVQAYVCCTVGAAVKTASSFRTVQPSARYRLPLPSPRMWRGAKKDALVP